MPPENYWQDFQDRHFDCCFAILGGAALSALRLARPKDEGFSPRGLNPDHSAQLLHRIRALVQTGLLFGGEFDLDDLLDAFFAQLRRNSDVKALDSVFAFEIGGAGESFLFVFENGLPRRLKPLTQFAV